MANLIITVIAIALVAIASLMGAYYGGAAFLNNQSEANAATVLNQAQQLAGAWNAYLADNMNEPPTDPNQLVAGHYLEQIPIAPAGPNGVFAQAIGIGTDDTSTHYFAYADMGSPVNRGTASFTDSNAAACARIIKTAIGPAAYNTLVATDNFPSFDVGGIYNGSGGNGTFGCALLADHPSNAIANSPGVPAGDYIMEYLLQ